MGVVEPKLVDINTVLFDKINQLWCFLFFKRVMRSVDNVFVGGGGGETVVFRFSLVFPFSFRLLACPLHANESTPPMPSLALML